MILAPQAAEGSHRKMYPATWEAPHACRTSSVSRRASPGPPGRTQAARPDGRSVIAGDPSGAEERKESHERQNQEAHRTARTEP